MRITAELSLYPLKDGYVADIRDFILELRRHPGIEVLTNQLSTQLRGELADVMAAVGGALEFTAARGDGASVLVAKFVTADLPIATAPRIA